jgi:hypothetical protein
VDLSTVSATSPFVSLFGTVVGIIIAMNDLDPRSTVKLGEIAGPSRHTHRHRSRYSRRCQGRSSVQLAASAQTDRDEANC